MLALHVIFFLADDDDASSGISVFFACIFLVILVAGGAFLVLWLRRRYWGPDDSAGPGTSHVGFTLGDLRHLHKTGQLSEEEFNRAKEKIVAAAQRAAQRDAPATKPGVRNIPPQGQ